MWKIVVDLQCCYHEKMLLYMSDILVYHNQSVCQVVVLKLGVFVLLLSIFVYTLAPIPAHYRTLPHVLMHEYRRGNDKCPIGYEKSQNTGYADAIIPWFSIKLYPILRSKYEQCSLSHRNSMFRTGCLHLHYLPISGLKNHLNTTSLTSWESPCSSLEAEIGRASCRERV